MFSKKEHIEITKIMLKAAGVEVVVVEYNPNCEITKEELEKTIGKIQQKIKSFPI